MAFGRMKKPYRPQHVSVDAWLRASFLIASCAVSFGLLGFVIFRSSASYHPDELHRRGVPLRNLAPNNATQDELLESARKLWGGDKLAESLRLGLVKPEVISWKPRVVHLHSFLSYEECDALIGLGRPELRKSAVVDGQGRSIASAQRTSSGMFLHEDDRQHKFVRDIEERIATLTMIPVQNGELLQILRYEPGQFYKPHPDFFSDRADLNRGGQRAATVLMYLQAAEEGGETHFPASAANNPPCMCGGNRVDGLCVRPQKGDAVLFWSTHLDGTIDGSSVHQSCSVIKGEKWSCTKWIRQNEFH